MADPKDQEAVRRVHELHREEIVRRYQAAGTGVGRVRDEFVIVVYLKSAKDRPQEPATVEGVPLKFEVTGEIKPQKARP
jgi:hypothetical protein